MVKTMAKLRMAHASTHGARKQPGPKGDFSDVFSAFYGLRSVTAVSYVNLTYNLYHIKYIIIDSSGVFDNLY